MGSRSLREVVAVLDSTVDRELARELQGLCDLQDEKDRDYRTAAEVGQMLLEKNKQLAEELNEIVASTGRQLAEKDEQMSEWAGRNREMAKRLEELQVKATDEISHLETKVQEQQAQLKEAQAFKERHRLTASELEAYKSELLAANEGLAELRRSNARLLAERDASAGKHTASEEASLRAGLTEQSAKLAAAQERVARLTKELQEARARSKELEAKAAELDQVKDALQSLHHVNRQLQLRDEEAQSLIAEYRNRIQQMQGALEEQQLTGSLPLQPAGEAAGSDLMSFEEELRQLKKQFENEAPPPPPPPALPVPVAEPAKPEPSHRLQEQQRLSESIAALRQQLAETLAKTAELDKELQLDRANMDQFQRKIDNLNKQITAFDEFVDPKVTEEARMLARKTQEVLAAELSSTLESFSKAENLWQEKQQALLFQKERAADLEQKIAKLQTALDAAEPSEDLVSQALLDESKEQLVRELIRLRSAAKRSADEELSFTGKIMDLRKRLNESEVSLMSSVIKQMMTPKELVQHSALSIESVMRDIKNLNIPREKRLLWQITDLLLECAFLRQRFNEQPESLKVVASKPVPAAGSQRAAKPAAPAGKAAAGKAAAKPAAPSDSPLQKMFSLFSSSSSSAPASAPAQSPAGTPSSSSSSSKPSARDSRPPPASPSKPAPPSSAASSSLSSSLSSSPSSSSSSAVPKTPLPATPAKQSAASATAKNQPPK